MFMVSISMFGTGQTLNLLIFKADTFQLISLPLRQYPDTSQTNPKKMFKCEVCLYTANYRGYIATWKIENEKLYLLSIKTNCFVSGDRAFRTHF